VGKDILIASLDSYHFWLHFWTATVVAGLIIEYLPTFVRFINKEKFKTEMIGGILITLGVAGELYVEVRSAPIEGRLRATEQIDVANAGREAANANERAGKADERAGKLEVEAATQRVRAAKAEEGLEQLRNAGAVQRERAAKAEKELLELQQFVKGTCSLNVEATEEILMNSPVAKPGTVEIVYANSECALMLANQLYGILFVHGWPVPRIKPGDPTTPRPGNVTPAVQYPLPPFRGTTLELHTNSAMDPTAEPYATLYRVLMANEQNLGGVRTRPLLRAFPLAEPTGVRLVIGPRF
jgi:hypothetical protein